MDKIGEILKGIAIYVCTFVVLGLLIIMSLVAGIIKIFPKKSVDKACKGGCKRWLVNE